MAQPTQKVSSDSDTNNTTETISASENSNTSELVARFLSMVEIAENSTTLSNHIDKLEKQFKELLSAFCAESSLLESMLKDLENSNKTQRRLCETLNKITAILSVLTQEPENSAGHALETEV